MLTKYWRLQQQQIPALKAVRESCDIAGTLKEYKDVFMDNFWKKIEQTNGQR